MKILVDADACPVIDEIIHIAEDFLIPVVLVKSFSHYSHELLENVEVIYVDEGHDAADFRIVQLAQKGDLVITQDYGLASLCLSKGCNVMHHKGFQYTAKNIDTLLHQRHISAVLRRSGKRTKGPKPFTDGKREKFSQALRKFLSKT